MKRSAPCLRLDELFFWCCLLSGKAIGVFSSKIRPKSCCPDPVDHYRTYRPASRPKWTIACIPADARSRSYITSVREIEGSPFCISVVNRAAADKIRKPADDRSGVFIEDRYIAVEGDF